MTAAGQTPSEEELAAVLAAMRVGGAGGAGVVAGACGTGGTGGTGPDADTFTAWRRRRLSALGVRAPRTLPR
ncbi:MAG TPA: hypothetical protein VHN80_07835 [Kineosporiaceae bacterium]|nr:hypothetical protein [Kineosporiaceae bacterium]